MYYYDSRTHACYAFNYSGCEGNGNRFASAEECEGTCVHQRPGFDDAGKYCVCVRERAKISKGNSIIQIFP